MIFIALFGFLNQEAIIIEKVSKGNAMTNSRIGHSIHGPIPTCPIYMENPLMAFEGENPVIPVCLVQQCVPYLH